MQELAKSTSATENWLGYHHARRIGAGESYDEVNMGAAEYPIMAPRRKRGTVASPGDPQGLIAKDVLCWVDGSKFVMGDKSYDLGLSTAAEDCPKRLVSMGANVIILPDKKYINTKKPEDCGSIEASVTTTGEVSFTPCDGEGGILESLVVSDSAPTEPANGTYWLDTGSTPNAMNRWSDAEAMWISVATSYVKIAAEGIADAFNDLDGVEISGAEENEKLKELMGSHVIWRKVEGGLIVIGLIAGQETVTTPITIARHMPNLDFMIESGNRLWGCRYGLARNGEYVNEIYASKQGDFKNWNVFQGISTDSWVGNCGSDGPWTGAVNYLGSPVFFKEGHIHRVYGNLPSQYSITDTVAQGVQAGSDRSLQIVSNTLLYLSKTAVCAYDGSMPTEISEALGNQSFSGGVAGSIGYTYYLSALDEGNAPVLLTYDLKKGLWHKEDGLRPQCWCSAGKELYCIDTASKKILSVTGAGEPEEDDIQWEVVTGEIGLEKATSSYYNSTTVMPEQKYISKLALRLQMEPGARLEIWIQYDGITPWEKVASIHGSGRLRSFTLPIRPKRCDWLRLKLKGTGVSRVYSLVRWLEGGSEYGDNDSAVLDF